jgi:hypothetical protein
MMIHTAGDVLALAEETRRALLKADELIAKLRRGESKILRQMVGPLSRLHQCLADEVLELEDIEARLPTA